MRKLIWILLATTLSLGSLRAETPVEERQRKALEILRKAMAERQRKSGGKSPAPATSRTKAPEQTFEEIEQQYLQGKITPKQFQKYIHDHPDQLPNTLPTLGSSSATPGNARPNTVASPIVSSSKLPAPAPVQRAAPSTSAGAKDKTGKTEATPEQKAALAEIEAKMEELERLKAAREKAQQAERVQTVPPVQASPSASAKPQRERLNDLLKLLIDSKITDAEYKARRAKILAEPH